MVNYYKLYFRTFTSNLKKYNYMKTFLKKCSKNKSYSDTIYRKIKKGDTNNGFI